MALLPSDSDEHSIDRLELELQVRRDFKQDYTFTNELIFINDLLSLHNYSEEDVARALNWAASADETELKKGAARVRQAVRIYATVRSIQEMSGGAIPITFFDGEKQVLNDLDSNYMTMREKDPEGAGKMREGRILALLAGTDYRDARRISGESITSTLFPKLGEAKTLAEDLDTLTTKSDIYETSEDDNDADILGGGEETIDNGNNKTLRPLAEMLAKSYGKNELELPSGKKVARGKVVEEVAEAIADTSEEVQQTDKATKTLKGPLKSLDEVLKKAKDAALGFQEVKDREDFDFASFKNRLTKVETQLDAILQAIKNHEGE